VSPTSVFAGQEVLVEAIALTPQEGTENHEVERRTLINSIFRSH
jgi:hypothetical protein